MIELIRDKNQWDSLLQKADRSDFYHTYEYHEIAHDQGEEPVLIHYKENGQHVLIPLLFREIKGTKLYDATSVYGYPGPLVIDPNQTLGRDAFREELQKFLLENGVVSIFSRLNPFVPRQEEILHGLGDIDSPGNLVAIDLKKPLDEQKSAYQKRLRTYINKSRKLLTVKNAENEEEIREFAEIYLENMNRLKAAPQYFFDYSYFRSLLDCTSFKSELLIAKKKETKEVIGGAMFMKKKGIIQYHLSAAKKEDLKLNPIKLIIDEMRIRGTLEGYHFMNLGGGVGNREDSLFRFKRSFSKQFKAFKLWKYIVNQKHYDKLVMEISRDQPEGFSSCCEEYFPCYRCGETG